MMFFINIPSLQPNSLMKLVMGDGRDEEVDQEELVGEIVGF